MCSSTVLRVALIVVASAGCTAGEVAAPQPRSEAGFSAPHSEAGPATPDGAAARPRYLDCATACARDTDSWEAMQACTEEKCRWLLPECESGQRRPCDTSPAPAYETCFCIPGPQDCSWSNCEHEAPPQDLSGVYLD